MAGTGAAVPSDAILDLKENAKTLDEFVSSGSDFVVGRTTPSFPSGKNIRTLTGINAVFDAAQAGQFVADSEAAADRAENAADIAMTAGWVYADVASGEAARVDGDYFWVVSADNTEVLELWLMGATTATDTGKRTVSEIFSRDNSLLPFKQFETLYDLSNAIKKIELSGDFAGRLLTVAQFFHRTSDGLLQIILANPDTEDEAMSSSSNTKYVSRFVTSGFSFSGVQRLQLVPYATTEPDIGGYITVDFDAISEGINVSPTSYVAGARLIDNRVTVDLNKVYQSNKDLESTVTNGLSAVNERVDLITNPYNPSNVSSNALSERFYKGILELELYGNYKDGVVCLSYFYYNPTTYDLTIILSRADNKDEVIAASSNTKFCSRVIINLPTYGGVQELDLVPYGTLSAQGIGGKLTIDLDIVTSGSTLSANYTAHERAFDMFKIENVNWQVSGGVNKYGSLSQALTAEEADPFYVGGNSFKSRLPTPTEKSDFICSNIPKKELSIKPVIKTYDIFYLSSKVKLEWIDSGNNFYYVADNAIIKLPNPISQALTIVANASSSDFVLYDVDNNTYYAVPSFDVLFTSASLSVATITHIKLTFDEEILIITKNASGLDTIMITESGQSSLRTMNFDGSVSDRHTFGEGVFILKDWSMSHHGDVMFIADYDSGVSGSRGTTGGQRCYVSLDNGYTFTECFQFTGSWTNLTNAADITSYQQSSAHIHCVVYDHKQGVVWLATGDGGTYPDNTAFIWSRDLGQTWTHQRSKIIDTGQKSQMVNAIPFDGCIAFGSDDSSINGMGVITYNGNEFVHEVARDFIPEAGALLMFARNAWQRSDNKVKYVSFGQDTSQASNPDARSLVCASSNGYDWKVVWEDNSSGIYGNIYSFSDSAGNIFVTLDGDITNRKRMLSIKAGFI